MVNTWSPSQSRTLGCHATPNVRVSKHACVRRSGEHGRIVRAVEATESNLSFSIAL